MRAIILGSVGLLALSTFAAVYIAYLAGWGSSKPAWVSTENTKLEMICYMEEAGSPVTIEFFDGGRSAIVESNGQRATVVFEVGGLAGDHYRGNGVSLMYDGEAYIVGMSGGPRGPCH